MTNPEINPQTEGDKYGKPEKNREKRHLFSLPAGLHCKQRPCITASSAHFARNADEQTRIPALLTSGSLWVSSAVIGLHPDSLLIICSSRAS